MKIRYNGEHFCLLDDSMGMLSDEDVKAIFVAGDVKAYYRCSPGFRSFCKEHGIDIDKDDIAIGPNAF